MKRGDRGDDLLLLFGQRRRVGRTARLAAEVDEVVEDVEAGQPDVAADVDGRAGARVAVLEGGAGGRRGGCVDRADRLQARLNDYANFARYRDANMSLSPPVKEEGRVVFMGDSITDSWKLAEYFPGKPYINRGISGQTTSQMLVRFRPDVIDLKPKVVVILAGTNDLAGNTGPTTLEAIQDNLKSMAELATAHGIRVVFASLLPVSDYEMRDGKPIVQTVRRPPDQILALNKWMKDYAATNRHGYLDYFSAMVDDKGFFKDELSNDGLHPNAQGYVVMAPLAEAAIAANEKLSAFTGDAEVIRKARAFLNDRDALTPLQARQLDKILLLAAENLNIEAMEIGEVSGEDSFTINEFSVPLADLKNAHECWMPEFMEGRK